MKEISSTIDINSDFVEPTQDLIPEDQSCSPGLANIQVCAVNFFSAHSMHPSIPADIKIIDYSDPDESPEDDPYPLLDNPDPSFDQDNPNQPTKILLLNSIIPSQHHIAPYNPDSIRGQFDTGAGVSCTNQKYPLHGYKPFTKAYPSLIKMTAAAIDESDKQSASIVPLGLGYLRLSSPSAPNGVIDVATYYSPALTSTLMNEHDILGITAAEKNQFHGISLTQTFHDTCMTGTLSIYGQHRLTSAKYRLITGDIIGGKCYSNPIIVTEQDASSPHATVFELTRICQAP